MGDTVHRAACNGHAVVSSGIRPPPADVDRLMRHEKKILTTFSIEPSFKAELTDMFDDMGLGWAAGVRFALKEFQKNRENSRDSEARETEDRRHIHR